MGADAGARTQAMIERVPTNERNAALIVMMTVSLKLMRGAAEGYAFSELVAPA
jgi:hypothetical protein